MQTYAAVELLKHLSPSFLTADDAVRYAMVQIDRKKDRPVGGYVLLNGHGHYQATQPLEGELQDFVFEKAFLMESEAERMMPKDYHYWAYYFCDIDRHAEVQRLRPSWSAQRIALTLSLPGTRAVAATYVLSVPFYSVGPEGSLVRFTPDPHAAEIASPSPRQSLPPENEPPERYVQQLAGQGTFSVVVSSDVWAGWRGDLSARWKAFAKDPQPVNTDPYFSQVYGSADAAMAFVHQRLLDKANLAQMGFLLKHQTQALYVVTEPQAAHGPNFDPLLVFRLNSHGEPLRPSDYAMAGIYWFAPHASAPPLAKESWLYERLISPTVLAHGIDTARTWKGPITALYVSIADGAQMRYVFSNSAAESRFYNAERLSGRTLDNGQQAALDEGRVSPRTYVHAVAASGELSVVNTSALWDVAGRVDAQWVPYSRYSQPTLSPRFVLADDAARYAHARIGSRREGEYIGLILKDAQQRFVATEPRENSGARFDWRQMGPVDGAGVPLAIPDGFSLQGIYSSRSKGKASGRTWAGDEGSVAAQMFTDTDIHQVLTLAPGVPEAYLSGSADSLIAFQAFAPGLSRQLFERTAPAADGSQLYRDLQDETLVPSDAVREMVVAGVLRVLVGGRLWGVPGKIESDWSPPHELSSNTVPEQPQLGPIFSSAQEAVADACERWRRAYAIDAHGLGLVLKSKTDNQFVATQTVPGQVLDRLYFASEFGAPVLMERFAVHSVYYRASGLPGGLRGQAAWLGRHFIGAQDLYAALYNLKGRQRGLTLYLSVLDGALLQYRTEQDPFKLFEDESGAVDANVLPAKLGLTLTAHAYVRRVAVAGQLKVLSTSDCWDVPGQAGADWLAYAQVSRYPLGPAFICADDAARHAQSRLGARRDKVYGGLILRRTDGLYTATEPMAVYVENFAPGWIRRDDLVVQSQFLGGSTAVARYHSRLAGEVPFALRDSERALYQNMFATDFLGAMLDDSSDALRFSTGLEYLFCDDGAVLSVASAGGALARSLAEKLKVRGNVHPKNNELEQAFRNGTLTPDEYVNRVARALVLRVVKGSAEWGRAARVDHWQAAVAPAVSVDGAMGPVFVQLPDALQSVHRQAGQRRQLSFGVVLKARGAEQYLASVPQSAGALNLTLDRLLVDGVPPAGFELLGMYLCPPAQPDILRDDPLYRYFISPTDLARAWGLRGPKHREYLPVFVGCIDGAWLKVAPRLTGPFGLGIPSDAHTWAQLKSTLLKPLTYVHNVATSVELTVLVSSEVWSAKGGVNAEWEPRHGALRYDPALTFGPLFSHPDDAARHARRRLGRSPRDEFLGLVLVDAAGTSFVALEPVRDRGVDSDVPQRLFLYESTLLFPSPPVPSYPLGFKLVAAHLFFTTMSGADDDTPADKQLGEHFVSRDVLGFYRNLLQVSGIRGAFCYLSTRQGALLKYVPRFTAREEQLFSGVIFGPPEFRPTQWLSRLATDGVLQVLDQDDYWTRNGVLKVDWTSRDGEEHPVLQVQPARPDKDEL